METRTIKKQAGDLLKTLIETCESQLRCLESHNRIDYTEIQRLSGKLAYISAKLNCENENEN